MIRAKTGLLSVFVIFFFNVYCVFFIPLLGRASEKKYSFYPLDILSTCVIYLLMRLKEEIERKNKCASVVEKI